MSHSVCFVVILIDLLLVHRHVTRYTKKYSGSVGAECLFRYEEPVSPHLAVKMQPDESTVGARQSRRRVLNLTAILQVPTDEIFVSAIANRIKKHAVESLNPRHMYVETAGGEVNPV